MRKKRSREGAQSRASVYALGFRDGIPIGLGYLAVAFSLGMFARSMGVGPWQGFFASLTTIASAGEYAGFSLIGADGGYWELALLIFVTNCRYLLMSCSLSQKVRPGTGTLLRLGMGTFVTDEIFGAGIARPGYCEPAYIFGLASSSVLPWALGTALGITVGSVLPGPVVASLSLALYGMFLAIIIPETRRSTIVAGVVAAGFLLSFLFSRIPPLSGIGEGMRVILLTVGIAGAAAALFPVKEAGDEA